MALKRCSVTDNRYHCQYYYYKPR